MTKRYKPSSEYDAPIIANRCAAAVTRGVQIRPSQCKKKPEGASKFCRAHDPKGAESQVRRKPTGKPFRTFDGYAGEFDA